MWMNSSNNAMHGVQFMGIINALKTGNPTLDMLVAMIVPVLLSKIFQEMSRRDIWTLFGKKPAKKNPYQHSRSIVYRSTQAVSGAQINLDQDSQNLFLIQAVRLFAHKHCDIDLDNATMELTSMGRTSSAQQRAVNRACNTPQNSTAALLQSCKIVERPVERKWHHVGRFDGHSVRMWMSDSINANNKKSRSGGEDESSGSSNSVRCIEIRLEATGPSAINAFVQTAYDWFLKGIEQMEDTSRYYYDLRTFDGSSRPSYVRYTLGNDKTFESLFSHDISTTLLKIVDQFQEKTGKFAIKGFPHKIGILLHGPAGTGKTSLIKALSHYTNRHIVNVPLDRITSNNQLMSMFFNKTYQANDNGHPQLLDFENVIFVLEDVDAATDVVKKRPKKKKKKKKKDAPTPTAPAGQNSAFPNVPAYRSSPIPDKLNLTGILNVLDGVVETPGRIVIMTTNHPEKLDPALIRPGRIDQKLELSYMAPIDVVAMLRHYFKTEISDDQRERVEQVILKENLEITPAQVEQLAMEQDNIEDLLDVLERRATKDDCSLTDTDTLSDDGDDHQVET